MSEQTSEEAFLQEVSEIVQLVARGDIEAFVLPGDVRVNEVGARRFAMIYQALAEEAARVGRRATLRWVFDPPGTAAAAARSESNAVALVHAIAALSPSVHTLARQSLTVEFVGYATPPSVDDVMETLSIVSR